MRGEKYNCLCGATTGKSSSCKQINQGSRTCGHCNPDTECANIPVLSETQSCSNLMSSPGSTGRLRQGQAADAKCWGGGKVVSGSQVQGGGQLDAIDLSSLHKQQMQTVWEQGSCFRAFLGQWFGVGDSGSQGLRVEFN